MSDPPKHHLAPSSVQLHTRSLHDLCTCRCQNTFTPPSPRTPRTGGGGVCGRVTCPQHCPPDSILTATQVSSHQIQPPSQPPRGLFLTATATKFLPALSVTKLQAQSPGLRAPTSPLVRHPLPTIALPAGGSSPMADHACQAQPALANPQDPGYLLGQEGPPAS